ncbi:50S ribosomal protein L10, partial [Lactobacillus sp. UMNPBX14]
MSEAAIAKKAEIVKQTTDMLNAAQSAIVVDYRGLTVAEVTDLRKQLR